MEAAADEEMGEGERRASRHRSASSDKGPERQRVSVSFARVASSVFEMILDVEWRCGREAVLRSVSMKMNFCSDRAGAGVGPRPGPGSGFGFGFEGLELGEGRSADGKEDSALAAVGVRVLERYSSTPCAPQRGCEGEAQARLCRCEEG